MRHVPMPVVQPAYECPRFAPGQDVREFLRALAAAERRNRALYAEALASGRLTAYPPLLLGEARRALAYGQLVQRLPFAARVVRQVYTQRAPVTTTGLAVRIGCAERTARLYLTRLEAAGVVQRRGVKGGWLPA